MYCILQLKVNESVGLRHNSLQGERVPIGWRTPFAGKRCRAPWIKERIL